ncbi:MAG: hypothetical protein H0Z28_06560 [Archaeoglobus sp.]|nr:hypothetical protein [Archaeoglobus sp.]
MKTKNRSKARYDELNPPITFRLSREERNELKQFLVEEGITLAEFVRRAIRNRKEINEINDELNYLRVEVNRFRVEISKMKKVRFVPRCSKCGRDFCYGPELPGWDRVGPILERAFKGHVWNMLQKLVT